MTDGQKKDFQTLGKAIDRTWDAAQEIFDPLMKVRPEKHGLEWDEAYQDIERAIGHLAELVEAEKNLQILLGLSEKQD